MPSGKFTIEIPIETWIDKGKGHIPVYVDGLNDVRSLPYVKLDCDLFSMICQMTTGKGKPKSVEFMVEVEVWWGEDPGDYWNPPCGDEERVVTAIRLGDHKFEGEDFKKLDFLFNQNVENYVIDDSDYGCEDGEQL